MKFPSPAKDAKEHARRLLQAPGSPKVMGYPPGILSRTDASVGLEKGHRPAVLLFYDNASRSSDLQAAEFLPLLVTYADRVDMIPIDVNASNAWTPAERKLIRKYYMAVVPTTVVLAGDRSPLMLKFQRISAGTLEAILEKGLGR